MDPEYQPQEPSRTDYFRLPNESIELYYEIRGNLENPEHVVLFMGSFATLKHFYQLGDSIAKSHDGLRYQVLLFDYRGVGQSRRLSSNISNAESSGQTSELLANDTFNLLSHVWPSNPPVHIYGASMGGMVAQILAVKLIEVSRLKSLFLAVTARAYGLARFIPLGPSFYRFMLPIAMDMSPESMIKMIVGKSFDKRYLESVHPSTGKTYRELWTERWSREYNDWFIFHDLQATSLQAVVAGRHYLKDREIDKLVRSRVPIFVSIAGNDDLIPPADQRKLADLLHAVRRESSGGHMSNSEEFNSFVHSVISHFDGACEMNNEIIINS